MEFLLRSAEAALSRAMLRGEDIEARREKLAEAWKIVLCLQFHDIIPGSSIREVYEDCHVLYGKAEELARSVLEESAKADGAANVLTVWNNANWKRETAVELPALPEGCHVETEDGAVPPQAGHTAVLRLPADGALRLLVKDGPAPEAPGCAAVLAHGLETNALRVLWNRDGRLVSVFDKKAKRELIPRARKRTW